MHADIVITNISKLYTPKGEFVRGKDMNNITEYSDAFIAIKDGLILDLGEGDFRTYVGEETEIYDGRRLVALPGFVDSHTHLVYGGTRENEFSLKLEGVPYLDILKAGGGILSTVEATRKTPFDKLVRKAAGSLYELGSYGVTTVEGKSGYGLNLETELKQLEVMKELNDKTFFDIVPTYLGAHAFPKEFKDNHKGYIEQLKQDMHIIKEKGLAKYVDIFCEDSVFNYEQSNEILSYAKELGFEIKIHADEIVSLGGAGLGVELGAKSADHLMAISDEDIKKISDSNTVANLLPGTSFYLNKDYAPARKLIDSNAIVAISSDMNPGSSPNENFGLIQQLACLKLKMTPREVLTATTINGAYSLGMSDIVGSLEIGKKADILLMDALNLDYIFYHYGVNHVKDIFKNGTLVFKNRRYV
jgi:imidazolonepropionase